MTPPRKWKIVRIILSTFYLTAGWLLFAGAMNWRILALGAAFSFIVALLSYDFFIVEGEADRRSLLPRFYLMGFYFLYLVYKMYYAGFQVFWLILTRKINPRVVHFRTRLKSDIARVVLANSITLTPGTIVLVLDDDHLIVHWLDAKTSHSRHAGDLIKGAFENILKRIWI